MTGIKLDRSRCAKPVVAGASYVPCGQEATIQSPPNMWPWAYCRRHAEREALLLGCRIQVLLSEGQAAAEERQKLEAIETALGAP